MKETIKKKIEKCSQDEITPVMRQNPSNDMDTTGRHDKAWTVLPWGSIQTWGKKAATVEESKKRLEITIRDMLYDYWRN